MAWLKAIHVGAIALWMAGLVYLPALILAHREPADNQEFARVRHAAHFAYIWIASPAAFVATLSGIALLLVADAMHGWMFAKLMAVGALVALHMRLGYLMSPFSETMHLVTAPRMAVAWILLALFVVATLILVLWKPAIETDWVPDVLQRPVDIMSAAEPLPHRPRLRASFA